MIINIISNLLSIIAAILTIVAAFKSRIFLSEIEKMREKSFRKVNCSNALSKLEKIISSIKEQLTFKNITKDYNNEVLKCINVLLDKDKGLTNACKEHVQKISETKKINRKNKDDYISSIKCIIDLYEEGKKYEE